MGLEGVRGGGPGDAAGQRRSSADAGGEGGSPEEQLRRALDRIVQLEDQNVALWEVLPAPPPPPPVRCPRPPRPQLYLPGAVGGEPCQRPAELGPPSLQKITTSSADAAMAARPR